MSSFSMVLLEEGVEMELPLGLSDAVTLLNNVVPEFQCESHGYTLGVVSRAQLGVRWDLSVKLVDLATRTTLEEPVGCIELEAREGDNVNFKVPPRAELDFPGMSKYDWDGKYFGSFIYNMLNTLHNRGLIQLPGLLPTI